MEFFTSHVARRIEKESLQKGFTLIELIIVVIIIGILFVAVTLIFNPLGQIAKSQNSAREHDLAQIQLGLDSYFHDTGCYPTSINFGTSWSSGGSTYLTKVPEDPKCQADGTNCYIYQTDTTSSCPQWNVLYSKLASPFPTGLTCPLQATQCVPSNMSVVGMNYCTISGNVDCAYVTGHDLVLTPPSAVSSPTPTPIQNVPSPTPGLQLCGTGNYHACVGSQGNACNSLGVNVETTCKALGGNLDCYCDTLCRINGVSQCN